MPDRSPAPLLEVTDLGVSFPTEDGPVTAVHGVSFSVGERETVCIVGESGSGKTVTLRSVLGLNEDTHARVSGSVLFRGRQILGLPRRELRRIRGREIGLISQDPMTALTPVHTIGWQIVEQIRAHADLSRRAARRRAVELLAEVGIPDPGRAVDRYPHQLSGGMRQRAVIAMAVSCGPSLLIADEPTTALDVTVQAQVLELLRKLQREFGSSIVLITHDMGVVAEMADRILVMYAGRIIERGSAEEIFDDPWHPYTWGLLSSIPPLVGPRPNRLFSIPGTPPSPADLPAGCAFAPRCRARFAPDGETPPLLGEGSHRVLCFIPPEERHAVRAAILRMPGVAA